MGSNDFFSFLLPENENEEDEQGEKDGHVVHGAQHDHQLASQVGHETDQFEDAQEAEGSPIRRRKTDRPELPSPSPPKRLWKSSTKLQINQPIQKEYLFK